jgi:hypothetical protein
VSKPGVGQSNSQHLREGSPVKGVHEFVEALGLGQCRIAKISERPTCVAFHGRIVDSRHQGFLFAYNPEHSGASLRGHAAAEGASACGRATHGSSTPRQSSRASSRSHSTNPVNPPKGWFPAAFRAGDAGPSAAKDVAKTQAVVTTRSIPNSFVGGNPCRHAPAHTLREALRELGNLIPCARSTLLCPNPPPHTPHSHRYGHHALYHQLDKPGEGTVGAPTYVQALWNCGTAATRSRSQRSAALRA